MASLLRVVEEGAAADQLHLWTLQTISSPRRSQRSSGCARIICCGCRMLGEGLHVDRTVIILPYVLNLLFLLLLFGGGDGRACVDSSRDFVPYSSEPQPVMVAPATCDSLAWSAQEASDPRIVGVWRSLSISLFFSSVFEVPHCVQPSLPSGGQSVLWENPSQFCRILGSRMGNCCHVPLSSWPHLHPSCKFSPFINFVNTKPCTLFIHGFGEVWSALVINFFWQPLALLQFSFTHNRGSLPSIMSSKSVYIWKCIKLSTRFYLHILIIFSWFWFGAVETFLY